MSFYNWHLALQYSKCYFTNYLKIYITSYFLLLTCRCFTVFFSNTQFHFLPWIYQLKSFFPLEIKFISMGEYIYSYSFTEGKVMLNSQLYQLTVFSKTHKTLLTDESKGLWIQYSYRLNFWCLSTNMTAWLLGTLVSVNMGLTAQICSLHEEGHHPHNFVLYPVKTVP